MNSLPLIIVIAAALGGVLGYFSKPSNSPRPSLLDYASKLTDQQQLLLLTVFGLCVATLSSLLVILYIFASGLRDGVVIGLATAYVTLVNGAAWTVAFSYWFQSSNSSRNKDKALAEAVKVNE